MRSRLAVVAPRVIKEFSVDLGTYRSGVQVAMLIGIVGLYFWPWLADKFGRRTLLAIDIAMSSVCMPLVALSNSFWFHVGAASPLISWRSTVGAWPSFHRSESPYWVHMKDRRDRIKARIAAGYLVGQQDQDWMSKADKVGIPQLFQADLVVWLYSPEHAGKERDEISV